MTIRGVHTMYYSSEPDALRAFLRDQLGFPATDVGGGWLIFDLPQADMGVHPTSGDPANGTQYLSFYCDDVHASVQQLRARGVEFIDEGERSGLWPGHSLQDAGRAHRRVVPAALPPGRQDIVRQRVKVASRFPANGCAGGRARCHAGSASSRLSQTSGMYTSTIRSCSVTPGPAFT